MKSLHVITIITIAIIVYLNEAISDGWEWFQICLHKNGKPSGEFVYHGIPTQGKAFIDTDRIISLVALLHDRCVLVTFDDGSHITVIGNMNKVWCKIKGGPGCGEDAP